MTILSELDFESKHAQYPNVPQEAIPARRFEDRTSNGLTQCILRWLELHDDYATRINTMGRQLKPTVVTDLFGRSHVTPGKWIPASTKRGTADIHAIINGRHVSIEVKVGRDQMSPEQHKAKQAIEKSGGVYFVARDFESFYTWYKKVTFGSRQDL